MNTISIIIPGATPAADAAPDPEPPRSATVQELLFRINRWRRLPGRVRRRLDQLQRGEL